MREERQIPKTSETVKIPQDLSSFLSDVHQLITEGNEAATTESDDLLQCESAVGGLEDARTGIFTFTYFSDEHGTRNKWELALSEPEIDKIAKGKVTELKLWACRSPACGCKFSTEGGSCFYCDWVDAPAEAG